MDRLTGRCFDTGAKAWLEGCGEDAVWDKLAAYEDLGTPEELANNMEMFAAYLAVCRGLTPDEVTARAEVVRCEDCYRSDSCQRTLVTSWGMQDGIDLFSCSYGSRRED